MQILLVKTEDLGVSSKSGKPCPRAQGSSSRGIRLRHILPSPQQRGFSLLITDRGALLPAGPMCLLICTRALRGEAWGGGLSGVTESRSPRTSSETSAQTPSPPSNPQGSSAGSFLWVGPKKVKGVLRSQVPTPPRCSERRVSVDTILMLPHLDPPRWTDTPGGHWTASPGSDTGISAEPRSGRAVRIPKKQGRSAGRQNPGRGSTHPEERTASQPTPQAW